MPQKRLRNTTLDGLTGNYRKCIHEKCAIIKTNGQTTLIETPYISLEFLMINIITQ